jgi:hypothetical protein
MEHTSIDIRPVIMDLEHIKAYAEILVKHLGTASNCEPSTIARISSAKAALKTAVHLENFS